MKSSDSGWQRLIGYEWAAMLSKACLFFVNLALLAAGLFNLAWGCYAAMRGQESLAITCLVAGLLLLLAASIDRFEVLKGFGLEAKTRELNKALTKADATLDDLRQLAIISGQSIIELSSSAGRWGAAPSVRAANERAQAVKVNLQRLGADPETIRTILGPWVRITLHEGTRPLISAVRNAISQVQTTCTAEAGLLHQPRSAQEEARYAELVARAQAAETFNREKVGEPWTWPAGSHTSRFTEIVRSMPVVDEEVRESLRARIVPWLPRLSHLESHMELLEPDDWYALDPNK